METFLGCCGLAVLAIGIGMAAGIVIMASVIADLLRALLPETFLLEEDDGGDDPDEDEVVPEPLPPPTKKAVEPTLAN